MDISHISSLDDLQDYLDDNRDSLSDDEIDDIEGVLDSYGDTSVPVIPDDDWDDYVQDLVVDTMGVPENVLVYFDFEKFKRDLLVSDYDYFELDGKRYYIENH